MSKERSLDPMKDPLTNEQLRLLEVERKVERKLNLFWCPLLNESYRSDVQELSDNICNLQKRIALDIQKLLGD